jgi:hypothetical protein
MRGGWPVSEYLSDFLLLLSVIGAPIILGVLLFYGMTASERRRHNAENDWRAADATRKVYGAEEQKRRAQEKAVETSRRPLDSIKRKTGTSG